MPRTVPWRCFRARSVVILPSFPTAPAGGCR